MVFSSLIFTYIFLPIVLAFYYLGKEEYRNYILLFFSLLFYSYGEPKYVFLMIFSIVLNYSAGILIDACKEKSVKKIVLGVAVALDIGILFVFKYLGFAVSQINMIAHTNIHLREIVLPIGISFFTFQSMSYIIDVYRGTVPVQKKLSYVALYISFFPQLIAGPIVRYSSIEQQMNHRTHSFELFSAGAKRFMLGFIKKVLVANNVAIVAEHCFTENVKLMDARMLWLGIICFDLQIFFDFSGYSDMAIGLGKMFGFEFEENFNYPYIAKSFTDFWRRWHISLSGWFRDYVYIPLGGSRGTKGDTIRNLLVVWLLTGIWHGANWTFIVWGLGYFVVLIIEKFIIKDILNSSFVIGFVWRIITMLGVSCGWVFFNSPSIKYAIRYVLGMFGAYGNWSIVDTSLVYYLHQYGIFIGLGIMFSMPVLPAVETWVKNKSEKIYFIVFPIVYIAVFIWATSYIVLGSHNPFIYFNF